MYILVHYEISGTCNNVVALDDLKFPAGLCQVVDGVDGLANLPLFLLYCKQPGVRVLLHLKFSYDDETHDSYQGLPGEVFPTSRISDHGVSEDSVLTLAPVILESAVAASLEVQPELHHSSITFRFSFSLR